MNVRLSRHGRLAVLTLEGDVDVSAVTLVGPRAEQAVADEVDGLVVDLTAVRYLDSAGVQMLFGLGRSLSLSRQALGLVVPPDSPLLSLVKITRLDEAAVVGATVEAVASDIEGGATPRW